MNKYFLGTKNQKTKKTAFLCSRKGVFLLPYVCMCSYKCVCACTHVIKRVRVRIFGIKKMRTRYLHQLIYLTHAMVLSLASQ